MREAGDLRGAIAAAPAARAAAADGGRLSAATSARRALQELLESAQRELAACEADEACDVGERSFIEQAQRAGEAWRKFASTALRDVKSVREIVVSLLEETEAQARADADAAAGGRPSAPLRAAPGGCRRCASTRRKCPTRGFSGADGE